MKKLSKRALSALVASAMLVGTLSGCGATTDESGSETSSTSTGTEAGSEVGTSITYPAEVEELGSGEPKWTESDTEDGYTLVTNEGGATLGYSKTSGMTLIQMDGYAFKDLNKNGQLDGYEDWRQEIDLRSLDLASQMTAEEVAGLMLVSFQRFDISDASANDQTDFLDVRGRSILSAAENAPADDQAIWANDLQVYAESLALGIPVSFSTDPRSAGVSEWPTNLGLAATFDPEVAQDAAIQLAKEYRALGLTTLLGPQIDLATEARWNRTIGTFGEDPALSRDMTNATISGYQSTYDEEGNDLGWGSESVTAMMKHWPGDGAAQSGRESHFFYGDLAVYPGNQFETSLIPFVDGGLDLKSITESVASVMSSYSIAWSEDELYGELVGTAFSKYKIDLLRAYGFEGVICSDWYVLGYTSEEGKYTERGWGMEEVPQGERAYLAIMAGVDQFGGLNNPEPIMEAYEIGISELGEETILARFQESANRLLKNYFDIGAFENPYVSISDASEIVGGSEAMEKGYEALLKSVVMLKNDDAIKQTIAEEKQTAYVPMVFTAENTNTKTPSSVELPVELKTLHENYEVVTDTVKDTLTGPEDEEGNATVALEDIIRASKADLADCDVAIVFAKSPQNNVYGGWSGGYDMEKETYIPIALQYGSYTADSEAVRGESIAGPMVEKEIKGVYGVEKVDVKQNISYYGNSAQITNATDLDMILHATDNMPETAKIIVALNATMPMVVSEFESEVDGIVMGFGIKNEVLLDIVLGKVEPSGLLPYQMPKNMETVEANFEDVPRDLACYVDTVGNTYDFTYGLNWSGKIEDDRTAKYNVPALVTPEKQVSVEME